NNYGPFQFPEKLIPLMITRALDDQPLPVYGDGANVRDWLFVDDHAAAIWSVRTSGSVNDGVYNIGGDAEMQHIPDRPMPIWLLGAGGMRGRALAASSPGGVDLRPMSHEQLDVTGNSAVTATLDAVRPDVVINASGYTSVDRAESERSLAFALNASAVEMLGKACARRGITVVHFSTDYVFDGAASRPYREIDTPSPINCYGESKLDGERALLSSGSPTLLIRTQWLFGAHGASFPRTMW